MGRNQSDAASQVKAPMGRAIETWENEGGAASGRVGSPPASLYGTADQVESAERIRARVRAEFDRVAASFLSIAKRQNGERRADTEAVIAIVEEKRNEVLAREQAGYFIHEWQDISVQVRLLVFQDQRYEAIRSKRSSRQRRE